MENLSGNGRSMSRNVTLQAGGSRAQARSSGDKDPGLLKTDFTEDRYATANAVLREAMFNERSRRWTKVSGWIKCNIFIFYCNKTWSSTVFGLPILVKIGASMYCMPFEFLLSTVLRTKTRHH